MPSKNLSHKVFEPFEITGLRVRNRFMRSATWDNTADDQGKVTDASVSVYEQLGAGGVGLFKRWERGEIDNSNCISCLRCHSLNDEPVQCRAEIKKRNP